MLGGGSGYACTVPFSFTAAWLVQHGQPCRDTGAHDLHITIDRAAQSAEPFAVDRHAEHDYPVTPCRDDPS